MLKDVDNKYSLARTTLAAMVILALTKFWYAGADIPTTMETALITLLLYELGKKGRDVYNVKH